MTNRERGEKLINQAEKVFERDLKSASETEDHNMVVRRAQETVELALKGALKVLGVDYPKVHDVGSIFAEQARKKGIQVTKESLGRIERISLWLAQARAPSFYGERDYGREDSRKALEDAEFVLKEIKEEFLKYPS